MVPPEIQVTDTIDHAFEAAVGGGLKAFNKEAVGISDSRPLAVMVQDASGASGGALGRSSLGLLFLDLFYLPKTLRGAGLGSAILEAFEEEGRRRGCRSAVLYTISFQAPGFYERRGWRRFGEIPCDPPGASRVFMTKSL